MRGAGGHRAWGMGNGRGRKNGVEEIWQSGISSLGWTRIRLFKIRHSSQKMGKKSFGVVWGTVGWGGGEKEGSDGRVTSWETKPSAVKSKIELHGSKTNKKTSKCVIVEGT